MLAELLENNKPILRKTDSYLLPLLDKIIDIVTIHEQTAGDDYTKAFKRTELPKGTLLLSAGTVCRHLWILEEGIARDFVCKSGVEITRYFFFPSEIIDSFVSSSLQLPSQANIELLEDSIVYSIQKSRLEELKSVYPLIAEIEKLLVACHAIWMEKRLYHLQPLRAQKLYHDLLARQPYLAQHISQHHLSSYLGISRETLSRARSSMLCSTSLVNLAKLLPAVLCLLYSPSILIL